jgi:hypothetical protein
MIKCGFILDFLSYVLIFHNLKNRALIFGPTASAEVNEIQYHPSVSAAILQFSESHFGTILQLPFLLTSNLYFHPSWAPKIELICLNFLPFFLSHYLCAISSS